MKKALFIIFFVAFLSSSCNKEVNQTNMVNATQETNPKNQIQASLSPNGKYRAEAFGTNTNITAGGLYPYEGIRILNTDNGEVIWKMEPGYYSVGFAWSPDSRYLGIYYEARTWGESIVFDTKDKKSIPLPALNDIAPHYGESVKPQENRPDPYFRAAAWENAEILVVDFHWIKGDGENFNGQYTFNVKTNAILYK